jgi:phosphatidate cytidylyltransferase
MKTRAITGVFFVVVLVAAVVSSAWSFAALFLIISLLSLHEFYRIVALEGIKPNLPGGLALGGGLLLAFMLPRLQETDHSILLYCIPLMTLIFWHELFRKEAKPFSNIAFSFLGVLFAVVPFIFFFELAYLGGPEYRYQYPLGFLIMLWASDTGAYLAGRTFGKTKLFERHSPKKTWEGTIGGLVISGIAAFILAGAFPEVETWRWLISSLIIVTFGTYGDLTESMLKRSYGIKDSGNILPGHGGLLDRFDGLLIAAPLVYLFLVVTG